MHSERTTSDFQLAKGLAQAIGLADCPPLPLRNSPFISNSPLKRERTRRPNTGDLQSVGRQLNMRRVRERQQSLKEQERAERERMVRKNAVKDVFVNFQKPQESPIVHARTKEIISRNDASRAHKYQQQRQKLRKISSDKNRRSKILGEMMLQEEQQMLGTDSQLWEVKPTTANLFFQPKLFFGLRKGRPREELGRLAESFELGRFSLIEREGELRLQSRSARRTQTAQTGRKTLRMRFNNDDKCEMLYASPSSSSSFFEQ